MHRSFWPVVSAIGFASIFGFSFLFSRRALFYIEPMHLLALRFLTAACTMRALRLVGVIRVQAVKGRWVHLAAIGLFQPILYFTFETIGIARTSASEAGMMVATIPIFTLLLAQVFLGERPQSIQIFGISLSVIGVALIGFMQGQSGASGDLVGLLLLLGAAISGGAYSVLSRHISTSYTPVDITYAMMNMGAVFFGAAALWGWFPGRGNVSFWQPLGQAPVLLAVLYLGILSSCAAFFLLNYSLSRLSAAQVGVFPSLTTLIAAGAGIVFLNESLFWYHGIGGLSIIVGVAVANRAGASPSRGGIEVAVCKG